MFCFYGRLCIDDVVGWFKGLGLYGVRWGGGVDGVDVVGSG